MSKATSVRSIVQRDLSSCRYVPCIFDLFRQFHFPEETQAVGLTIETDELSGMLRDQVEAHY